MFIPKRYIVFIISVILILHAYSVVSQLYFITDTIDQSMTILEYKDISEENIEDIVNLIHINTQLDKKDIKVIEKENALRIEFDYINTDTAYHLDDIISEHFDGSIRAIHLSTVGPTTYEKNNSAFILISLLYAIIFIVGVVGLIVTIILEVRVRKQRKQVGFIVESKQ